MDLLDKYLGSLLGLAIGDAMGAPVEFMKPGSFPRITGFRGGGPWGLRPGEWTDDTSMSLCLAESLTEKRRFDPEDQLRRFLMWYRDGHLSVTGICFDIGNTTRKGLERFEGTGEVYANPGDDAGASNGSLMRLAPVPLFFAADPAAAIEYSSLSSLTTHGAVAARDSCRYMGGLIAGALSGASKDELTSGGFTPIKGYWEKSPLTPPVRAVARGSFRKKDPPSLRAEGYAVKTLESALWALHRASNFEDGLLMAANLGNDSDTVGAVYGQLAGALYGATGIPGAWRSGLAQATLIEAFARALYQQRLRR